MDIPKSIGQPATNALKAANITNLKDLQKMSEKELTSLHGVGPKAIRILKQALDENNMCLLAPNNQMANGSGTARSEH